jgi:hypothetical protein
MKKLMNMEYDCWRIKIKEEGLAETPYYVAMLSIDHNMCSSIKIVKGDK